MDRARERPDTGIQTIADLKHKKIAVTRGTDPFVFLLRALASAGLSERDVELVALQHADGKAALERGDVDAWAGLDPLMAASESEHGSRLFFRQPDWNSYGVLDVRDEFATKYPKYVDKVIAAYERARKQALSAPLELQAALIREAGLKVPVAEQVLNRTDISSSELGEPQKQAILAAGDVLKRSAVIQASADVPAVVNALLDNSFRARSQ